jgi:hypothetical protein
MGGPMSFLTRLLQTTGLSLALMTASAAGVRAAGADASDTEIGADGVNAVGPPIYSPAGPGGPATASATASSATGNATASGTATGGNGGIGLGDPIDILAGPGGPATASATASSVTGYASASTSATGGNGAISFGEGNDSPGGGASAISTATGFGGATSIANAIGGYYGFGGGGGFQGVGGDADATANGGAFASAVATTGQSDFGINPGPVANASSNAEAANGATAEAVSSINSNDGPLVGSGKATAKTSLGSVSVQSNATTQYFYSESVTVEAIAQVGGSGPTGLDPDLFTGAISIALPDKAYATTLIDEASNVADALLRPGVEILGIEILGGFDVSSTINFSFHGDLILGDISDNSVSNLGFAGPDSGLSISDTFGIFVLGGAVPEPSTWAMLLLGFAGLGYAGRACKVVG